LEPDATTTHWRVGVRATGVVAPVSLRLTVTGAEELLTVTADGDHGFVYDMPAGTSYQVELTSPEPCALQGASGIMGDADAEVVLWCGMLENLAISGNPEKPDLDFVSTTLRYRAEVSILQGTTAVTATARLPDMTITAAGEPLQSGVAGPPIALALGETVIPVAVFHEPSGARLTYEITVRRAEDNVLGAYVKASNTNNNDSFGWSVAVSADGSTLAVGATGEASAATGVSGDETDNNVNSSGAVYVYRKNGTTWVQEAYVKASNTGASDEFGNSVALSDNGNVLAVGARYEDSAATGIGGDQSDNSIVDSGAAYVFRRSGTTWAQEAYVKASNAQMADHFGYNVALSGDGRVLVVGAPREDSPATGVGGTQTDSAWESGAVYVYRKNNGNWFQEAFVKASNTGNNDLFGTSLALSSDGNVLAVAASREDSAATGVNGDQNDNSVWDSGAVYVFRKDDAGWAQEAYVKASNTGVNDRFGEPSETATIDVRNDPDYFGNSVALSADGSVLAVGAHGEDSAATGVNGDQADNSALDSGAVYVFRKGDAGWAQEAYVKASNTDADDRYGSGVALSADGSVLAVGAHWEDSAATGVDGDELDNSVPNGGAVYVLRRGGVLWSQEAYVKAHNPGYLDEFGWCVAMSHDGGTLAVGAWLESSMATGIGGDGTNNDAPWSGAVYLFW
jgi:hypothetical protein